MGEEKIFQVGGVKNTGWRATYNADFKAAYTAGFKAAYNTDLQT